MLTMLDEYTRECLAIDVERRLDSEKVLERLTELFTERGTPTYVRSDNGAEFTAKAVREWQKKQAFPYPSASRDPYPGRKRPEAMHIPPENRSASIHAPLLHPLCKQLFKSRLNLGRSTGHEATKKIRRRWLKQSNGTLHPSRT